MPINENCIKTVHLLYQNRTLLKACSVNANENQWFSLLAWISQRDSSSSSISGQQQPDT